MENHPLKNLLSEVSIHNFSGKVITDLEHYNTDAEKIALAVFETLNNENRQNIIVTTDGNINIYVVTTYDSFESFKNKVDEIYDSIENPILSKHHFLDVWLEQCSNTSQTGIIKLNKYVISDNNYSDSYKIAGKNQSYKIISNDDIEEVYKDHLDTYVGDYLDENISDNDLRKYFDEDSFKDDIRNEWDNEGGYAKLSSDGVEHTVEIANADMFSETYYILLQD